MDTTENSAQARRASATYYFQGVLGYSPIKTGVAFLAMVGAIAVIATLTQSLLLQHLTMRVIVGTAIGSAAVVAVAVGQQGVAPRDAGTAGALNNVSQQLGSALGVAVISTFVATATSHYVDHHGSTGTGAATVHGFSVGYWWAAGAFWAAALLCGALVRGGTRLHHEAGQRGPLDEIVSGLI